MSNPTFWQFAIYLIIGLVLLSYVPGSARGWLIAVLIGGGLVYVQSHGGLDKLLSQLEGK